MRVIGCDPGGDGALYELNYDPQSGRWNPGAFLLMPMVDVGKRIKQVDTRAVRDWLNPMFGTTAMLAIETVGYMPSGTGKSGFSGGAFSSSILTARYNRLVGMLEALDTIPFVESPPQTWKAKLGVKVAAVPGETSAKKKERVKSATLAMLKSRYPSTTFIATPRSKKPHDGLIDALALAHYATTLITIPASQP